MNKAYAVLLYFQWVNDANLVPWQFYATDKTRMFQCPALALNLRFLIARASCIREIHEYTNTTTDLVVLTRGLPRNAKEEIGIEYVYYYNNNTENQNNKANFAILETNEMKDNDLFDKKKRPICLATTVSFF